MCEYCKTPGKILDVIEMEERLFVNLAGAYIQTSNAEE